MSTAAVNGIELYYERRGDGPRLLFLNGSGATLATAGMLVEPFTERFETVAHDQRGLGRTSIPRARTRWRSTPRTPWPCWTISGGTAAGWSASASGAWSPRSSRSPSPTGSSAWPGLHLPGGEGGSSYPLDELVDLTPEARSAKMAQLLDTRFAPEWLVGHPGDRQLVEMLGAREHVAKSDDQRRGEVEQLAARRHHDVWNRLPAVRCPTLVACGRYDGSPRSRTRRESRPASPTRRSASTRAATPFFAQDPAAFPDVMDFLAGPAAATS